MTVNSTKKPVWPINERYKAFEKPASQRRRPRLNWIKIRDAILIATLWAMLASLYIN